MDAPSAGLDTGRVQAATAGAVVGHRIVYRLRTGSTMDDARALAHGGAAEGTVVVAEEQGAGRGRFDRRWVSPPGLNLYFTILLLPEPSQLPSMNMAAALAVHGMVNSALQTGGERGNHPHSRIKSGTGSNLPPSRGRDFWRQ